MKRNKPDNPPLKIEIKSGIPLPVPNRSDFQSPITLALKKMKPGDCFDLPAGFSRSNLYQSARSARVKIKSRLITEAGKKIFRVWKIKDDVPSARAARAEQQRRVNEQT